MQKQNQKGITLIALIITIIVMLILVGVTINVALNGGLFEKAETVTYQTEASLVKEQLEIAKAIELANAEGKEIEDYSYIKVESLDGLDPKTKTKFKDIILVNPEGNICYNPANVTDEERTMLEAIGIIIYESDQLTEEEIEEIQSLILQFAIASENNDTEEMEQSKNALLEKGINFNELIVVGDMSMMPYTYYMYCHNSNLLVCEDDLSIRIPTNDEIEVLDELYNIAVAFDNELKSGRPAAQTSFSTTYNGETITALYQAGPWSYYLGDFKVSGYNLDTDGKFVGI